MILKPLMFLWVSFMLTLGFALMAIKAAFSALIYVLVIALPLLILIKLGLNIIFGS